MRAQNSSVAAPVMLHTQAASGLHSPAHPRYPVRARRAAPGGASIWTSMPLGRRCGCTGLRGLPRSLGGVQLWVPGTIRVQVGEVPVPRTTPSHNLERQLRAQRVT